MFARFTVIATCVILIQSAADLRAESETARFTSADGVNLVGTFYRTNRRNPPTVLILHALGEDSSKKGWGVLAEELSANGFAVLSFDFRGHGKSTTVNPAEFWLSAAAPNNTLNTAAYLKGTVGRKDIEFKEFNPSYYSVLINDIAAARAYLDRKNDAGECNTSNLIIIGAEDGGTLGAGWINSEYYRFRARPAQFPTLPPIPDKRSEGEGIVGCVWLSLSHKVGGRDISLPATLQAAKARGTPNVFLYSKGDELGAKFAAYCEKNFKDKNNSYTQAVGVDAGALRGVDLIQQGSAVELRKYLEGVVQARGNEWEQKDFRDAQYYWMFGSNIRQWQPAKPIGDTNLFYNTYSKFLVAR